MRAPPHLAHTAGAILRIDWQRGGTILTISNLLTLYRLAAAPVAAWMALTGQRDAFFILVILSLFSDLVDGPIARWLDQRSSIGAKLDTVADACTVLAAILGVYLLEFDSLRGELPWLYLFLASYGVAALASVAKFGTLPAYHLYLSKAAAFCSGVFFVALYLVGYAPAAFIAVAGLAIAANVESLLVTLRLSRFRTDIGSLAFLRGRDNDTDA